MLIEIDDSIRGVADEQMAGLSDSLRRIAQAHCEGKHFVSASRAALGFLEGHEILDDYTRTSFRIALRRIHDAAAVRSVSLVRLHLFPSLGSERRRKDKFPQCIVFNREISEVQDSAYLQGGFLIGENKRDARFYFMAAKAYLCYVSSRGYRGIECALSPIGGGGDTTFEVFEDLAKDSIACAVVDSDRGRAGGAKGTTARKLLEALSRVDCALGQCGIADVHVLEDRELENLLPESLVMDAIPDEVQGKALKRFMSAKARGVLGSGGFLDLKAEVNENMLEFVVSYASELTSHKLARYLFANHALTRVSPLCREPDLGGTGPGA